MMVRKGINYAAAYLLWVVTLLLALWLVILVRSDFLGALGAFYTRGSVIYIQRARFFDKVFVVVFGLLWLTFMIVTEEYLRTHAQQPGLLKRFAKIAGPVVLLIVAADLFLFWLQGIPGGSWSRWLILAGELVTGLVFLWYARPPDLPNQTGPREVTAQPVIPSAPTDNNTQSRPMPEELPRELN